jgi:fructose-1,6-bisphosphatase I
MGLAGNTNVQGEEVKKLDVLANDIFINALRTCGKVSVMVSEENEHAIFVEEGMRGKYCVVFDPLDGSSNIDAGVNIGTIFGIYRVRKGSKGTLEDVLRPGTEMVAAGYCNYGSMCNLMLTTGNGVNGYTLDSSIGEFILTHPNIRLPPRGKIYSVNEGNAMYWDRACTEYFNSLKFPPNGGKPYSARYIGSMVADVHRTLLYGGIFAYPADSKSKKGKLRVLYECFPMAMLIEQAGGKASTGFSRMLELKPQSIHERSPIFLGSREDVEDIERIYAKYGKDGLFPNTAPVAPPSSRDLAPPANASPAPQSDCKIVSKVAHVQCPAPAWEATAVVNGQFKKIKLSDYAGRYLVMVFYPLDFTFVCPTELIAFSDRSNEFKSIGAEVVGISVDSEYSHLAWCNTPRNKGGLGDMKIPLISDITKEISRKYNVLVPDGSVAMRGLFIIDPKGVLRIAHTNDLPIGRNVDEALRLVEALQFHEKHGEVCPAGWSKKNPKSMKADPQGAKAYFESTYK